MGALESVKSLSEAVGLVSAVASAQSDESEVCECCGLRVYANKKAALRRKQLMAVVNKLKRISQEIEE